jgi:hypothetical protein
MPPLEAAPRVCILKYGGLPITTSNPRFKNRREFFFPVKTIHPDPVIIAQIKIELDVKVCSNKTVAAFDIIFKGQEQSHIGVFEKLSG